MSGDLSWPLGRSGDRTLVVLDSDIELIAPIFAGEPEPEDHCSEKWVPVGLPSFDVPPDQVADELAGCPGEIWLAVPRSDTAVDFHVDLAEVMIARESGPPAPVFLPEPLTLEDLVGRLPTGREAAELGPPSRHALFVRALVILWVANAPDEWLAPFILSQASPETASLV
jgi:hypothetical protein